MGDYSVTWTGNYSATVLTVDPGDPVVIDNSAEYLLSTLANRTALGARRTSGIARTPVDSTSRSGDVQHSGIIPAVELSLGPGLQSYVRVTDSGTLARTATPVPADDIIGLVDTAGNMILMPGLSGTSGIVTTSNVFPVEIISLGNERGTDSATYERIGSRTIDTSLYPATIGALARSVKFVADLDITAGATSAQVKLFNLTDNQDVTGADLSHNTTTCTEKTSIALTVGGGSGNIRSDHVAQYTAFLKMNGGVVQVDQAFCTNARIVIAYA